MFYLAVMIHIYGSIPCSTTIESMHMRTSVRLKFVHITIGFYLRASGTLRISEWCCQTTPLLVGMRGWWWCIALVCCACGPKRYLTTTCFAFRYGEVDEYGNTQAFVEWVEEDTNIFKLKDSSESEEESEAQSDDDETASIDQDEDGVPIPIHDKNGNEKNKETRKEKRHRLRALNLRKQARAKEKAALKAATEQNAIKQW